MTIETKNIKTLLNIFDFLPVTFGKNIVPRIRPDIKPNMLAKLSIIGSKPMINSETMNMISLENGIHGFSYNFLKSKI